jgi:hypothetical protein
VGDGAGPGRDLESGTHLGHEGIGAYWDQSHAMASIELVKKDVIVCGTEMVMLFEVHATIGDNTMILDAVDVFVIGDDNKIVTLKAYWDMTRAR